jgi:hypothetical protein
MNAGNLTGLEYVRSRPGENGPTSTERIIILARNEALFQELIQATDGLFVMSETDAPLVPWHFDGATTINPEVLREYLDLPEGEPETGDIDRLLASQMRESPGMTQDEMDRALRFKSLHHLLTNTFTDIHLYRFGEIQIAAVLVGKAADGQWYGLSTTLVET